MNIHPFERFKRRRISTSSGKAKRIKFVLRQDAQGNYIDITDGKGSKLALPDPYAYQGAIRQALLALSHHMEDKSFVIDWSGDSERAYLDEIPYVLPILLSSGILYNSKLEPLENGGTAILSARIEKQGEENYHCKLHLDNGSESYTDFRTLTEDTAITGRTLYTLPPLGIFHNDIQGFNTDIKGDDLGIFLSLLHSFTQNIKIQLEEYKHVLSSIPIEPGPALIFREVDEDGTLFVEVAHTLSDIPLEALNQFDLEYHAAVNPMEKTVIVRPIAQLSIDDTLNEVSKAIAGKTGRGRRKSNFNLDGNTFVIPKESAGRFVTEELPKLMATFSVFGAEKLKKYKVSTKQPSLDLSLGHGIDFLEGKVNLDFEGEKIDLFQALKELRKNSFIKLSDGTNALLDPAYIKKLERIFKKDKNGNTKVSFFDLPLIKELIEERTFARDFKASREIFEGFNTLNKKKYRFPKINATLRPYQKEGFKWMRYLMEHKLGGCLADDMGLGKTIQTLALMASVYPEKETRPSLVVMPRSLLFNWAAEAKRFTPNIKTHTHYGLGRDWEKAKGAHLVFTTYATMRNDIKQLSEEEFFYVILDESQNIKNTEAQTTKAVLLLQAENRLALSGTPLENNLSELYSLFRFLNPSMFGSMTAFQKDYLTPIQKASDKMAMLQLRRKIYPFILRRLKTEVLKDLPDKTEQVLYVEMNEEHAKFYEKRRAFYQALIQQSIAGKGLAASRFFVFQALNELRQIATIPESQTEGKIKSPKLALVKEKMEEIALTNRKALLFANFIAGVEKVGEELNDIGMDYIQMTGATRDRQSLVERFQSDPDCKAFIMTLKTGGTGLNLTAADTVFILDPWWNAAAESQAIDRAHRIGQKSKVIAYKLITLNTIEEKILQLQEVKKELFDNLISSDGAAMKSLSEEDINFILS